MRVAEARPTQTKMPPTPVAGSKKGDYHFERFGGRIQFGDWVQRTEAQRTSPGHECH
jgi:hypothetical protein